LECDDEDIEAQIGTLPRFPQIFQSEYRRYTSKREQQIGADAFWRAINATDAPDSKDCSAPVVV